MSFDTKEITLHSPKRVILQDKNGPCPLLAIANTLILLEGLTIDQQSISSESLISELQHRTSTDLQQYKHCLLDGLDANPRFDGTFEGNTADFFALFGLQLVHGWVIPQSFPASATTLSYDQLMDRIVADATDADALVAKSFIDTHPSQLSPQGIELLESTLEDGDVVILFRNNHYSTLVKHEDLLLTLVTDQGFASYNDIVWESLDGKFYQSNFQQRQDCSRDEEIARELQREEDERNERDQRNERGQRNARGQRNERGQRRNQRDNQRQGVKDPNPNPNPDPNPDPSPDSQSKGKKGKCIIT